MIEPHDGLTILYGENGTGKTGYSRIFKTLANSRTADTILGNIDSDDSKNQSAYLEFMLGDAKQIHKWNGERGVPPFTRMSIFDSPSVTTHVDDDLTYVFTPASLALFSHLTIAIQEVEEKIGAAVSELTKSTSGLLTRFQRGSTVYPLIETIGASTDLVSLKAKAVASAAAEEQLDSLTQAVAALQANTTSAQIATRKAEQRVLLQAATIADVLQSFDASTYNETLARRSRLVTDYQTFRRELFSSVDLPAEPDHTWSKFIEAGVTYRQHLEGIGVYDSGRCLYCRQSLLEPAQDLLTRYSAYLEDKISIDIRSADALLSEFRQHVNSIQNGDLGASISEYSDSADQPSWLQDISVIEGIRNAVTEAVMAGSPISVAAEDQCLLGKSRTVVGEALTGIASDITALDGQLKNRNQSLEQKQHELLELKDSVELGKSWPQIEARVNRAKEADQLKTLKRPISQLVRTVTTLAKTASDQLINQSFDALFLEECDKLRAPTLKLQFVGREGKAQRRKVMSGRHKPSKVLSEGEQKVLALADFLAEARLTGITAPVIFDDPVSSLDHRRLNEVAQRIAQLADDHQVIVFTHDILLATTLLSLFEKSKRCVYFQVTDDGGKGKITRATGPRWDTLKGIQGKINSTVEAAKRQDGEARDDLIRTGYNWIRSWCEVFTETELLQGVTQRYQPNVGMTRLPNINTDRLAEIIPKVTEIYEEACRYIDGHSQPLVTLGVSPTLDSLEQRWTELKELKKINEGRT